MASTWATTCTRSKPKSPKKAPSSRPREWVDHRDRADPQETLGETEEDTAYTGKELDRSVVNPSQIRQVIQAMKTAVETQIFPTRKETPKTLIFAKTDSHADDIINIVREVYGQGNAFCKKVTYRAEEDADSILASFRNDYHPRIAVTVDMIATGTDVKPLEVLLFMRDVRSKGYYEQMKGRGVRSLDGDSLKRVSNSADGAKTRFVLIDAVGVEKSLKTESRPLEKKPGVALKDLLQGVAMGSRDDDTVLSLANRLVRLAKQLDDKAQARIEKPAAASPWATGQKPDHRAQPRCHRANRAGHRQGPASPAVKTACCPKKSKPPAPSVWPPPAPLSTSPRCATRSKTPAASASRSSTTSTWIRSPSRAFRAGRSAGQGGDPDLCRLH
jgi:type I site-specific restriction endonuclease